MSEPTVAFLVFSCLFFCPRVRFSFFFFFLEVGRAGILDKLMHVPGNGARTLRERAQIQGILVSSRPLLTTRRHTLVHVDVHFSA